MAFRDSGGVRQFEIHSLRDPTQSLVQAGGSSAAAGLQLLSFAHCLQKQVAFVRGTLKLLFKASWRLKDCWCSVGLGACSSL